MIRTVAELDALRDEWDALAARHRSPLLAHAWYVSCAETLHEARDLRILTVRRAGALTGAVALASERVGVGRRLTQLGVSRLYEPCDWLADGETVAAELLDRALDLGQPMLLQRLRQPSLVTGVLATQARRRAFTLARPSAASLGVPTRGRWDDYWAGLSGRLKSNLRYAQRKAAAAHGAWTIERQPAGPDDVDAILEDFAAIEGTGWKGRHGSSLSQRPELRAFFRAYARRVAARGELHVARLVLGSRLAAMEIAVLAHDRLWQLKIGYDEALKPYSPGMHLTASGIRWAFDHGLEAYEFLGSAEPWEERWQPEVRTYQTVAVYPYTPRGGLAVCADALAAVGRRFGSSAGMDGAARSVVHESEPPASPGRES